MTLEEIDDRIDATLQALTRSDRRSKARSLGLPSPSEVTALEFELHQLLRQKFKLPAPILGVCPHNS